MYLVHIIGSHRSYATIIGCYKYLDDKSFIIAKKFKKIYKFGNLYIKTALITGWFQR